MEHIDVFSTPAVIAYLNGSGGNRLRYFLLGQPWDTSPGTHLNQVPDLLRNFISDLGYPKWPTRDESYVEGENLSKYPILTTHGMNSLTLRRMFPKRKIIKIYCDLRDALLRHYLVFGKQFMIDRADNKEYQHTREDLENYIKWNLDFYLDNIDSDHDYAVYIAPGQGPFEDFMCQEFSQMHHALFKEAWHRVILDSDYYNLAKLLTSKVESSLKNLDSGICRA